MPWATVRGHDELAEALRRAVKAERFPHAFLFVGPEGVGKRLFALTMAQALLCTRNPESYFEPCGQCPSCHQVMAGTHPDVLQVSRPEERHELPIDAIRKLNHDLSLSPMRGKRRVAIVDDADHLSEEASNAFLKTLEEPPPGSVLILVGTAAELQLDTILSRCRVTPFRGLSESDLKAILLERQVLTHPDEADSLAARAEGSMTRALALADPELEPFRRKLIEALTSDRWLDAPALARGLEQFSKEAGKESAAVRQRASVLVGEMARFFRSVLWQRSGQELPSAELEDRQASQEISARLNDEQIFKLIESCLNADYHIARKAYLPLAFENLMGKLAAELNTNSRA